MNWSYRRLRSPWRPHLRFDGVHVRGLRHSVASLEHSCLAGATIISVLSLLLFPVYAATGGIHRLFAAGFGENALQAVGQGILAGPAAMYLFAFSIEVLGVGRAAVFPVIVPALTLLAGWILLDEVPTGLQATGSVTVLLGFLPRAAAALAGHSEVSSEGSCQRRPHCAHFEKINLSFRARRKGGSWPGTKNARRCSCFEA